MEAASGQIVSEQEPKTLREEVESVLAAFEQTTGMQICARLMSERWRDAGGQSVVPWTYGLHRSRFCEAVKARDLAACMKCDHTDLPLLCMPGQGPFVRTCHAGADEVLVPLWSEGVLVAVIFLGQFRRRFRGMRGALTLRQVSEVDAQRLRDLTLSLQSYMLDVLSRLDEQRREHTTGRRGVIEAYIRRSLPTGPSLPELAGQLSLSPSRASHIVRELTGRSFQQLVEQRRIAVARDLLTDTGGKIAWVARQTGFRDIAYFCRYFKRKTGLTPTAFRKRHRRVGVV
jgi:AraC-like DNA-binding protein